MAESKAWLEHEATGLLGGIALAGSERIPVSVTDLKLDNCVLGWSMDVPRIGQPARFSVSLKDLDINRLVVVGASTLSTGNLWFHLLASATTTITSAPTDGSTASVYRLASLPVRSVADGQRVAHAVRRAATFCGAPSNPS